MSGRALSAVESYVEARNAADVDALLSLFGDDASLRHAGGVVAGHAALRNYFSEALRSEPRPLTIARLMSDGNVAIVELWRGAVAGCDERRHAVEVLVVDADAQIQELNIYRWEAARETA